ncbi:MAG: hypothetical protein HOJ76_12090 [Proteobacteria bacterium]|nr:hypothetical protein [Pseudomonadota bacterium]
MAFGVEASLVTVQSQVGDNSDANHFQSPMVRSIARHGTTSPFPEIALARKHGMHH